MLQATDHLVQFRRFSFYATVISHEINLQALVRFDVSTAVTTKNAVFWDVTPNVSCKNRRFGGT
jgi:hypothetical protein